MKSAYELAMERLKDSEPSVELTDQDRAELAAIDEKFQARIAEREVFLTDLIAKAAAAGNHGELAELETQKSREVARIREEAEEAKERFRAELAKR